MKPYERKVQYYETDMMGIAHHANYIHWMEEARIDFMEQIGYSYAEMEGHGVYSPVRNLNIEYRHPCTFNDTILIRVSIAAFNGARLIMRYEMRKKGFDDLICTATSEHAFMDSEGKILRLKRAVPELSQKIELLCEKNEVIKQEEESAK
ncbi:MAG: acyl-CoA thioesterase [Oscillospiraceae bacterium]|nr:acyl-CoA thioesterase [Oscillospiraceae bacterium]